jgi:hypothetical protein
MCALQNGKRRRIELMKYQFFTAKVIIDLQILRNLSPVNDVHMNGFEFERASAFGMGAAFHSAARISASPRLSLRIVLQAIILGGVREYHAWGWAPLVGEISDAGWRTARRSAEPLQRALR